jgi:hypothetical protein
MFKVGSYANLKGKEIDQAGDFTSLISKNKGQFD